MGFVSNSSSSSFCIYGIETSINTLKELLKIKDEQTVLKDLMAILFETNNNKIYVYTIPPYGDEFVYIGREYSTIGDDETGKEFKESVEKTIKKILNEDIKCSIQERSWTDS
jgi:hypothetical protein